MKKVLVISYYWPPAGGISVLRSLKIVKYLRGFGWEPVVYTAKNAQYPYFDNSNDKDIPEGVTVIKHPIIEPFDLFKKLSGRKDSDSLNNVVHVRDRKSSIVDRAGVWVRGNFFIPDARALWIGPSVRFLKKYLKENPVDAIFTDGPPHTNTAIACKLKASLGIPWLADFQDPWTQVDYYQLFPLTSWADKKHKKMEQNVFKHADQITIVSPSWKKDLERIGAQNVEVVYWGYDEDDFKGRTSIPDEDFTISHVGLMGMDRNPENLFKALQDLKSEIPELKKKLKLQFAGQIDYSVLETIKTHGLEENLINLGIISREKALEKVLNSHLLLLLLNKSDNVKGRLPGKLYEYLAAKKEILCLGPEDSDANNIVLTTKSGRGFDYQEDTKLKEYIRSLFLDYSKGKVKNKDNNTAFFTIKKQTEAIAGFLDKITSQPDMSK